MKRKALMSALLGAFILIGCASDKGAVPWDVGSVQAGVSSVQLEGQLWINKMPVIGEAPSAPLHGDLVLTSYEMLASDLEVEAIWLRHNEQILRLDDAAFRVEAMGNQQWNISFKQSPHFSGEVGVLDVSVLFSTGGEPSWVVKQDLPVETVF